LTSAVTPVWGGVIVAAGQGQRFGPGDKILMALQGRPVICWSVAAIVAADRFQEIVIVTSKDNRDSIRDSICHHLPELAFRFCIGGQTRSASVRLGLEALSDGISHVAIHDGARPLASAALIRHVVDAAERDGAAVPCVKPTSSIGVRSSNRGVMAGLLDRNRIIELQTPQAARRAALQDALARYPSETDESSALFRSGYEVTCVPGERSNIKITQFEDLAIASAISMNMARNA
jgi:2-C-methyl-D-erythritol 4-phosphate cytidylyltransferase